MSFWGELRRRNVFKVAAAYLVGSWLIGQVISVLADLVTLPDSLGTSVVVLLGIGFPFALTFAWVFEATPEGLKRTSEVERSASVTRLTGQRLTYVVTILLALAVVLLVLDNYVIPNESSDAVTEQGIPGPTDAAPERLAIAVLPFDFFGPDDEYAYVADALPGMLHRGLKGNDALRVIADTSTEVFRDRDEDAPTMGEILGAEYLVDGDIRSVGNEFEIDVDLIRVESNEIIGEPWSYTRELDDILDSRSGIVSLVVAGIEAELGIGLSAPLLGGTDDPAAREHYYRAESMRARGDIGQDWLNWRAQYLAALELDQDYADAWIGLGQTLSNRLGYEEERDDAIDRALEIAPELPGSYRLLAEWHQRQHEWREAELAWNQMLERSPRGDAEANERYGRFLTDVGRARDALAHLEIARESNPADTGPLVSLMVAHDALGNYDSAIDLFDAARSMIDFDFTAYEPQFLRVLAAEGVEAAWAVPDDFDPDNPRMVDESLPEDLQAFDRLLLTIKSNLLDQDTVHTELLRAFDDPLLEGWGADGNIAFFAAHVGDTDLSIDAYRRSVLDNPVFLFFAWTPIMQRTREHPDFKQLMIDIGLVDYWRQNGWPDPPHCRPVGDEDFVCG